MGVLCSTFTNANVGPIPLQPNNNTILLHENTTVTFDILTVLKNKIMYDTGMSQYNSINFVCLESCNTEFYIMNRYQPGWRFDQIKTMPCYTNCMLRSPVRDLFNALNNYDTCTIAKEAAIRVCVNSEVSCITNTPPKTNGNHCREEMTACLGAIAECLLRYTF